jgi:glycosyltransferase involved in cell wall biosynthesis
MIKYSLVIPCYNEAASINVLLDKINVLLQKKEVQVVLVNNGSIDDTHKVFHLYKPNKKNLKYIRLMNNKGYGYGIIQGLKATDGEIIGWTHADLQTNPLDFLKAIELIDDNFTFVKGNRYGRTFLDYLLTFGMSVFESILFKKKMYDINAQPTVFSKNFFSSLPVPPNDFSLDLFFYFYAIHNDLSIKRFPVFFGARFAGSSSWNTGWLARFKFIRRTIQFSLRLKKEMKS